MGLNLRYAAYTLPWLLDFKQKVASIPVIPGSGTGQVSLFTTAGHAGVTVNLAKFGDRIDQVIADDEGSLIRVFDGADVIDEWIAKRGSRDISADAKTFPLSGAALASIFDQYVVPAFDAPANPAAQGNWSWGGKNLLGNPGLEEGTVTPKWFQLDITATGGTYTLTDGTDTTSGIAFNADASTISTRIQTDLGDFTDVVVVQNGTSPRGFAIQMVDPPFGSTLAVNTGSLTGGTATVVVMDPGETGFGPWTRAGTLAVGKPSNEASYVVFGVSTAQAHTGAHSLAIDATPSTATSNRMPGAQQVPSVTGGAIAQASVRVYPTNGADRFRLGIFGVGEEFVAWNSSNGVLLTPNTWNQITVSDFFLPADASQIVYRIQNANPGPYNPSLFYVDDGEFYEGLVPTTPGDILSVLFDAHSEISNWVDYSSFDASADSNGDAWPEDISFEVQWGEHYGHVLDRLVDLGYEWELRPKTVPVGTLTHDFHLYNSGGRDATYQNSGVPAAAINKGQSITGGEVIKRIPDYTDVVLEGAGGAWSKVTDATTESQFGVLEKHVANRQLLNEPTRVLAAEQFLAYEEANRRAVRVELVASRFHPRALVKFRPGDSIPFQIPPAIPKQDRRVQRVDYTNTHPTRYVVTGSRVLSGDAAAFDLIWRLYRRFSRPPEQVSAAPVITSGGGTPTIYIAAADALEEEKVKAGSWVCDGFSDRALINEAIALMTSATRRGGRLICSSGAFNIVADPIGITYSGAFNPANLEIQGVGRDGGGTIFRLQGSSGSNRRMFNASNGFWTFRNITLDANGLGGSVAGINSFLGGLFRAFQCQLYGGWQTAMVSSGGPIHVENCTFIGNGVDAQGPSGSLILKNYSEGQTNTAGQVFVCSGGSAIDQESVVAHNTIINNLGYGILSSGFGHVHHNTIVPHASSARSGILITSRGGRVHHNNIRNAGLHGIETEFANANASFPNGGDISNNMIVTPKRHGIFVDMPHWRVYDNDIFDAGQSAANTYDGIHISHDAATVRGNRVRSLSGQTRYGVRVDTGTGTIVVLNDYSVAADYGTAEYSDAGTGTIITLPTGAIGANFAT